MFKRIGLDNGWDKVKVNGIDSEISGVVFSKNKPPDCGMPLGGIDTGCIDIDSNGNVGFVSIFNSLTPRTGSVKESAFARLI